jgi:hypothetical protein
MEVSKYLLEKQDYERIYCFKLAQNRTRWQAFLNTECRSRFHKSGQFLDEPGKLPTFQGRPCTMDLNELINSCLLCSLDHCSFFSEGDKGQNGNIFSA